MTKSDRDRLPPGQYWEGSLPVLDLGVHPNIAQRDWTFTVAGAVERRIEWDWRTFMAQPQIEVTVDIHCVTTWSVRNQRWIGVAAKRLLDVVRPRAEAGFLVAHGHDGYTTNLPLVDFDDDDVLLAHTLNGAPLPREHGGPVRLMVPKLYFWKSAKWLRHMVFLDQDSPGYWEARGYHDRGDPWKEERFG